MHSNNLWYPLYHPCLNDSMYYGHGNILHLWSSLMVRNRVVSWMGGLVRPVVLEGFCRGCLVRLISNRWGFGRFLGLVGRIWRGRCCIRKSWLGWGGGRGGMGIRGGGGGGMSTWPPFVCLLFVCGPVARTEGIWGRASSWVYWQQTIELKTLLVDIEDLWNVKAKIMCFFESLGRNVPLLTGVANLFNIHTKTCEYWLIVTNKPVKWQKKKRNQTIQLPLNS